MNHYVYETTNLVNGKKYIGKRSCHCTIEKDNYMGSGILLKKAIEKYGKENFKKDVLYICESEDLAYVKEKELIHSVEAWNNDMYYNLDGGGRGSGSGEAHHFYGKTHTEVAKRKIGEAHKGNKWALGVTRSEETKRKISEANKGKKYTLGRKMSEQTKIKIGEAHKGNKYRLGKTHTEVAKIKIGEAHKGNKYRLGKTHTEESKIKMSEARKGKKHSSKTKKKISRPGGINPNSKKIILLNEEKVFECCKDAPKYVGLKSTTCIFKCLKGKQKSAGKINGEPAKWMYYEDYLKQSCK